MADCAWGRAERRTFLIEASPETDILLRVLGLFAVRDARVLTLEAAESAEQTSIRIEVGAIDADAAGRLVARLREMPAVRTVGAGWRACA